jgi:hypothetical protein
MPKVTRRSSSIAASTPYARLVQTVLQQQQPEESEELWEEMFGKLLDYFVLAGDCDVPLKYCEDSDLGVWVQRQRDLYRQNRLRKSRFDALEALEFEWQIEEVSYASRPTTTKQPAAQSIVARKSSQQKVTKNKPVTAAPQRTSSYQINENHWNRQYTKLQAFFDQHGHVQSTRRVDEALSSWAYSQRRHMQNGRLPKDSERYIKLDQLGFWNDHALTPPTGEAPLPLREALIDSTVEDASIGAARIGFSAVTVQAIVQPQAATTNGLSSTARDHEGQMQAAPVNDAQVDAAATDDEANGRVGGNCVIT